MFIVEGILDTKKHEDTQSMIIIVISKFSKDVQVSDYGVEKIITFKFHTVRKITVITHLQVLVENLLEIITRHGDMKLVK